MDYRWGRSKDDRSPRAITGGDWHAPADPHPVAAGPDSLYAGGQDLPERPIDSGTMRVSWGRRACPKRAYP